MIIRSRKMLSPLLELGCLTTKLLILHLEWEKKGKKFIYFFLIYFLSFLIKFFLLITISSLVVRSKPKAVKKLTTVVEKKRKSSLRFCISSKSKSKRQ